jgi:hypothetical protein
MTNTEKIIATAREFLGQCEGKNNTFEDDSELGRLLHKAGQKDGEAWCSYFCEAIFCKALPESEVWFRKYFSASVLTTLQNFIDAGVSVHMIPKPGDIMIMEQLKDGKRTGRGHMALVVITKATGQFNTIDGNTSDGNEREGKWVAEKKNRRVIKVENGLNIVGFLSLYRD